MATDLEILVVQLSADIKGYQRELLKAQGITNRQARAIENRFKTMNRNLDSIGRNAARSLIAPLSGVAAALSVREVINYADAWKRAGNILRTSGVPANQLTASLEAMFGVAQKFGQPLEEIVKLYGRVSQSSSELGAQSGQLITFMERVAASLVIGGSGAAEARGALIQLSQALGSTTVRAEEYNSINEGARPILIAVARGMDEAGGSLSKLRRLVIDGEVTSREFFQAFLRGSEGMVEQATAISRTFGIAFQRIENAFTRWIGQTDESLGASQRLIAGLDLLSDNFDQVADTAILLAGALAAGLLGRGLGAFIKKIAESKTAILGLLVAVRNLQGMGAAIGALGLGAGPLGAIFTVAAAGAVYLATSASEAEQRSRRLKTELKSLGLISDEAAESVDKLGKSLENLAADEAREKLRDINDELRHMRGGQALGQLTDPRDEERLQTIIDHLRSIREEGLTLLRGGTPVDEELDRVSRQIEDIAIKFRSWRISGEEAIRQLEELAKVEVSEEVDELNIRLRQSIEYMAALEERARQVKSNMAAAAADVGRFSDAFAQQEKQRAATAEFLAERTRVARLSDREEDIEKLVDDIKKAAEEQGVLLTEAQALAQATLEVDQALSEKKTGSKENAYERETEKIREQIAALQAEMQLRNQGTLAIERERIARELRNAATEAGIQLTATELENINALAEAFAQATAALEFQDAIESAQDHVLSLEQQAEAMGLSAAEAERLKVAQDLLTAAQEAGIAVGLRFATVQELISANVADLTAEEAQQRAQILGLADAAGVATQALEDMKAAEDELTERLDLVRDISKDFLSGFLQDLREGKSLTDALVNALNRLADKLLDFALDNIVESLFGARGTTQGGLFGGVFGGRAAPAPFTGGGFGRTAFGAAAAPLGAITSRDVSPPVITATTPALVDFADSLRAAGRNLLEFSPAVIGAGDAVQATTGRFDSLLGLIRRGEGTAASGFSTTLGYGRFLGGAQPDLTRMTLDQVRQIQTQMLQNPANTFNASPAGAFQITRRTLDSLREQLGLTGQELFTPELQTRLAEQLIQNRLDQAGRLGISPVENLRSEFEGLRSIDTSQIQAALDQAGQQISSSTQQISSGLQTAASSVAQTAGQFAPQFGGALGTLAQQVQSAAAQFAPQFQGSLLQLLSSIQSAVPAAGGLNLGQIASLSGFAGLFQHGGRIGVGQWGIVGEKGPEIAMGPATIIPPRMVPPHERQRERRGDLVQNNHFTIHGPIDRRSENQIATKVANSGRRSVRTM